MISKSQKLRLGIFVSVSLAILVVGSVLVAAPRFLEKRDFYTIRYVDVSVGGLEVGGNVKYHGISIGRIEDIYVDPENVAAIIVEVSLRKGTPIKANMEAVVAWQGITGVRYIELVGGTKDANTIPPGGEIPAGLSMVDSFIEQATIISNKLQTTIDEVTLLIINTNEIITESKGNFDQITENVTLLSGNLVSVSQHADSVMQNVVDLTGDPQLTASIENLYAITVALRESVEEENLPTILDNLNQLIMNIDQTTVHFDRTLVESRDDIIVSFEDLRLSMENLREITEIIRDNPSVIIRGMGKEEISQ